MIKRIPIKNLPLEEVEQMALIEWMDSQPLRDSRFPPGTKIGDLVYSVPNEGKRAGQWARKLRRMGLRSGVPDIVFALPVGKWPGLYIEMKRARGGRVSPTQANWIENLTAAGYRVEVCEGWDIARQTIKRYLSEEL